MITARGAATDVLKESTREAHEALDARLGALIQRDAERGIAVLLRAAADVVPSWEERLRGVTWPPALDPVRRLQKVVWLQHDLGAVRPPGAGGPPMSMAEAWGALYVLEGSTLGSSFIRRTPVRIALESRYLAGYGDATGTMWKNFREQLDAAALTGEELAVAVATARRLFAELAAVIEIHG